MLESTHAGDRVRTFGPSNAEAYGTTSEEYRLWVDYVFDLFGATIEKRIRRYTVAIGFSTLVILVGFAVLAPFGFAQTYFTSAGIYILWIGAAWCFNALRWLSQTYHIRTNRVRPCFQQTDDISYKKLVSPYAARATQNRQIFFRSMPFIVSTWVYFTMLFFASGRVGKLLRSSFPRSLPPGWHTGSNLAPKLVVLCFFSAVATVHIYTGARLTLATTPLYICLSKLPVTPVPKLVTELFSGILDLYQTGTLMWSFGLVLAELLFNARLDLLGIAFVIVVAPLGLIAFAIPRAAVRNIVRKSRTAAIETLLLDISSDADNTLSRAKVSTWNDFMISISNDDISRLNLNRLLNLVGGQLLPAVPLIINTLGGRRFG